ncbi:MAG: SDR family NAD(P)-dependent oxidoreductase, partial [Deltaproteobacteria bacterium]
RNTDWLVDGYRARPAHGPLPPGAMHPVTQPVVRTPVGVPSAAEAEREQVVGQYLDTMRKLVESQREVMLAYLGASPGAGAPAASAEDAAGGPARQPAASPAEPEAPRPAAAVGAGTGPGGDDEPIDELLLGIVSERTGYPLEMLDLDLDLEADLSIDSIKRIEILGLLGERIGLGSADTADRDAIIEELAAVRTLRGILTWLDERLSGEEDVGDEVTAPTPLWPSEAPAAVEGDGPSPVAGETGEGTPPPLLRFVVDVEPAARPDASPRALRGRRIMLADDGAGVARALAARLAEAGAEARIVEPGTPPENGEDLVDLTALAPGRGVEPARHLFGWARAAAGVGPRRLLAATGLGGGLGGSVAGTGIPVGGPAGLLKTVARERPEMRVRVVDLDPADPPERLAEVLVTELADPDLAGPDRPGASDVEVGWRSGVRVRQALRPAPLDREAPPRLALDAESVVLVTGGARGIAARAARALMQVHPCRLELVGRTPLPAPETDAELASATDRAALRRLLLARGELRSPRDIEAACDRILAGREVRANLEALAQAGATVRYHAVDVRDAEAFGQLIDRLYEEHGRIDGVVHAAGVLEDRLLSQKTADSFDRVFDTKVVGARVIARHLRPGARFVVFFGSVSGVLGNRGQVDYAAANDALDKLARVLNGRLAERVVSIDWGPWGGGGMVSPELEREYRRRGVGLIDPDAGARAFVDELLYGDAADAQVLWMCGSPESLV